MPVSYATLVFLHIVCLAFAAPLGTAAWCRCTDPSAECWPSAAEWASLNASVGGALLAGEEIASPSDPCLSGEESEACATAITEMAATEFWTQQFPGGQQSSGWAHAWWAMRSEYAVAARSSDDIAAAVAFASRHDLRLVIKGAGHDYLGRSSAADSLLVWTHRMQGIVWGSQEVTVEAGVRWEDVIMQAQARGRLVLSGGCPSVGAAGGFPQGGGWGHFSRDFGTAADNMLSATVVTANGEVVIANATSNPDLFWALRGGGGGTFGVVVSMSYRTWPAPRSAGSASGGIFCPDTVSAGKLFESTLVLLRDHLLSGHWGENLNFGPTYVFFDMSYNGIDHREAQAVLEDFNSNISTFGCTGALSASPFPNVTLPDGTTVAKLFPYEGAVYPQSGDPIVDSYWTDPGNAVERNAFWASEISRYLPLKDLEDPAAAVAKLQKLLNIFPSLVVAFTKALGGSKAEAGNNVSYHPDALDAAALLISAMPVAHLDKQLPRTRQTLYYPLTVLKSDACPTTDVLDFTDAQLQYCWEHVDNATDFYSQLFNYFYNPTMRSLFPTGSYVNEADFFEPDWQTTFWGSNYERLLAIKGEMDPQGLFVCHHCVGSEDWSADGNCRASTLREKFVV